MYLINFIRSKQLFKTLKQSFYIAVGRISIRTRNKSSARVIKYAGPQKTLSKYWRIHPRNTCFGPVIHPRKDWHNLRIGVWKTMWILILLRRGAFRILIHWPELYPILIHWPELYPILIHWAELFPILIHWPELYPIFIHCRSIPYLNTLSRTIPYLTSLTRTIPYLNTLPTYTLSYYVEPNPILIHYSRQPIKFE